MIKGVGHPVFITGNRCIDLQGFHQSAYDRGGGSSLVFTLSVFSGSTHRDGHTSVRFAERFSPGRGTRSNRMRYRSLVTVFWVGGVVVVDKWAAGERSRGWSPSR